MNIASNAFGNANIPSSTNYWLIGILVVLAIAVAYVYLLPTSGPEPEPEPAPEPVPEPALEPATRQHWCLVGEDLTGRYCVRVPSEASCDSERLYNDQITCEGMPQGMRLPAGRVMKHGMDMQLLRNMNIV